MASKGVLVKILHSDGSYGKEWATVEDKYTVGNTTGHIRMIRRGAVFAADSPVHFDTVRALLRAPTPAPIMSDSDRHMVAEWEDPQPIEYEDTASQQNLRKEAEVLLQVSRRAAVQDASRTTFKDSARTYIVMLMAGAVALLTTLFGLAFTASVFLGD